MIVSGFIYPTRKSPSGGYLFDSNAYGLPAQLELSMAGHGRVAMKVLSIQELDYGIYGREWPRVGDVLTLSADTLRQYLMSNSWERWFPVFGNAPGSQRAPRSPAEVRQYGLLIKSGPITGTDMRAEEQRVMVWLDTQNAQGLGAMNPNMMPLYDEPSIDSEPEASEPAGEFRMSMTYGVVPDFDTFLVAWEDHLGGRNYSFMLVGSDARTAARYGIPPEADATPRKLYSFIQGLVNGWEEDGDEEAGTLASGFLITLGFEWV